jgi:dTDP-4-dehydrorhamnose 3,5-epimerase
VRFEETAIAGAYRLRLDAQPDARGFFARTFCERSFAERGLLERFPQQNLSRNARAGTLRGLHLQVAPHGEVKVVRCVRGAIFDVAVDLRPGSRSYLRWVGLTLDAEAGDAFYVPEGCAHGFVTLSDDSDVLYLMGAAYAPEAARSYRWNDPAFGIVWPREPAVISDRDRDLPDFDGPRP